MGIRSLYVNKWKIQSKQKEWLEEVVRIITPGTVMDQNGMDEKKNNYILSFIENEEFGLCYCDVSTGELKVTHFKDTATLLNEITTINPNEIVIKQALSEELKDKST